MSLVIQNDQIRTEEGVAIQAKVNSWNSRRKFEIPALLQDGTICHPKQRSKAGLLQAAVGAHIQGK